MSVPGRRASARTVLGDRLAFAERLLSCDEPADCARLCLEWLATHAGVRQALCAALDLSLGPGRLITLAHRGLEASARDFSLDATREDHPLVEVLSRKSPMAFRAGAHLRTPLGDGPVIAVPLGRRERHKAVGLLLARPPEPLSPDLGWAARLLGERLASLHLLTARAEERRWRERDLLLRMLDALPDPVLLADGAEQHVLANARARWLFVWREGESAARKRIASVNQGRMAAAIHRLERRPGTPAKGDVALADPAEGPDLPFEFFALPVEDEQGRMGTLTLLRQAPEATRAGPGKSAEQLQAAQTEAWSERRRLEVLLDAMADPALVTEPSGDIVLMNGPAERLFRVPLGGGAEAEKRVRANEAHFESFVGNLVCSDEALRLRGELMLLSPATGAPVPVEALASKVLSESGALAHLVTLLRDRSDALEKAKLYEQLVKASDELEAKVREATAELAEQNALLKRQAVELEQASQAKSLFLANMSHEFRTPLNAILGYTQILLQGVSGALNPGQKKSVGRVDSNGRHLLHIVNEILDITRIEAGRMPVHPSRFKLGTLVDEVLAELEPIIQRSGVPVVRDLPSRLPQVSSDRQKVKQIVLNLLSNALKFTHQGEIRVRVRYDAAAEAFTVAVSDTGIGIPADEQQKVFEDFHQVDGSPTRAYGGTGLGLGICRRLAGMLGGGVTLQSKAGEGSTFTLQLPARPRRA